MVQAHMWVSGRVQGVCFRASAEEQARSLGLTGWVRNLPDGRVEALVEGPDAEVDAFLDWCQGGPPGARVEDLDVQRGPARGAFTDFSITD